MFGDQTVGVWGALGEDDRRRSSRIATAQLAAAEQLRPDQRPVGER